jgi:hypothetical protein
MASTTYLTLVNSVLKRLREKTVTSVSQNQYSQLIGEFINDAKREVEDAWNWDAIRGTYSFNTVSGTVSYALTGAGDKARILSAYNDTEDNFLEYVTSSYLDQMLLLTDSVQEGQVLYYNPNGIDTNGDMIVDVYPQPNSVQTIRFNLAVPEAELSSDSDTTFLPKLPIIQLAHAKAIEERGEDGGIGVNSQYAVAKQSLADAIAIEAGRRPDEVNWAWI